MRKLPEKTCEHCDKRFAPHDRDTRFCPRTCLAHWRSTRPRRLCSIDGCGRPYRSRSYCKMHHARFLKHGDPGPAGRIKAPDGSGYLDGDGYRWTTVANGPKRREHHVVMEEMIGRPLQRAETVHHRNGIRHDNRPENLELWTSAHPFGQRVEDLVAFAMWVLEEYGEMAAV